MGEWHSFRTADLIRDGALEIGDGYRAKNSEMGEEGLPFIRAGNVNGGIIIRGCDILKSDSVERVGSKRSKSGDVVLTTKGTVGRIAYVNNRTPEFVYSPQLCYWRSLDRSRIDPRFLYYALHSPEMKHQMDWSGGQTDMAPYISLTDQRKHFHISLPDIHCQREIGSTLGALDDKIELSRRMNETLEAMARAIFKDWFVDFGPTRTKLSGGEPYLAPDLWALFPDTLNADSIPEGWEEKPLDEIAHFLNGLALQKYPASDPSDSLPVIKIAELRSGVTAKSNRASRKVPDEYVIRDGDFLFSWSGSLMAKFWTEGDGALNQHLFKVTSEDYPMWFVSQWVYHHLEEFQAIAAFKATTMGHIQRGHLKAAMTVSPPTGSLSELGKVMAPLVERTIKNDLESRTLAQIRDLLLPKLMSGEIRLRDAEREVEKVA